MAKQRSLAMRAEQMDYLADSAFRTDWKFASSFTDRMGQASNGALDGSA